MKMRKNKVDKYLSEKDIYIDEKGKSLHKCLKQIKIIKLISFNLTFFFFLFTTRTVLK